MSMGAGHSVIGIDAGHRFSTAVVGLAEIWATSVRRKRPKRIASERDVSPTALCGRSAEAWGDALPVITGSVGGWQVQHDAQHRRLHADVELQEVFAQSAELAGSEGGARGAQAQLLVEHVGGGGQKIAQLIGEEAAAPAHSLPRPCILTLEGPFR
jgi:hypothetical protein